MPMSHRTHRRAQGLFHYKKLNIETEANVLITPVRRTVITYQNVAGAKSKVHKFNDILSMGTFDVVALTETHFDSTVSDTEILSGTNYVIIRRDRASSASSKSKGGGVCCILRNEYQYREMRHFDEFLIEHLILRILIGDTWIILATIYLPPGRARKRMIDEFATMVTYLKQDSNDKEIFIVGDFNWPMATWEYVEDVPGLLVNTFSGNALLNKFCNVLAANGLHQRNKNKNENGRVLDLVVTTTECIVTSDTFVIGLDRSTQHHRPIEIRISLSDSEQQEQIITQNDIKLSRSKMMFFNSELQEIQPNHLLNALAGNSSPFLAAVNATVDKFAQIQEKSTRHNVKRILHGQCNHPWTINKEFVNAYKKKLWARTKDRAFGTQETRMALKNAYQVLYAIYNSLKTKYYAKILNENCTDTRRFYSLMRSKRKPIAKLPNLMSVNGRLLTGDARCVAMVTALSKIFEQRHSGFATDQAMAHDQLRELYTQNFNVANATKWPNFQIAFTMNEIEKALMEINPRKDPGPMGLSCKMLQYSSEVTVPLLYDIINGIVQTGFIPEKWLQSFVTPIPKKGSSVEIQNYRGIAQQSVLPKLLDKLLTSKIIYHMEQFLPNEQHGFRRKRGTTSNLLEITTFIQNGLKQGKCVDVIYFDYSKAFDTMSHKILGAKLAGFGMPFVLFRAVMMFIMHKKMILKIDGIITNHTYSVSCGVPQGSHIGPVLFTIFTADLVPLIINIGAGILQYADDTKIFKYVNNEHERRLLQRAIDKLQQWSTENELTLNESKTCWLTYGRKKKSFISFYHIGYERLTQNDKVRDLGIYFDPKMSFKYHYDYVLERTTKAYAASYRFAIGFGNRRILLLIYNIYIRPIIEYGAIIWTGRSNSMDVRLEEPLRKITRFVLGSAYRPYMPGYIQYDQRLSELQQLPTRTRRVVAMVTTLERIRTGKLVVSFADRIAECFILNPERHRLNLRYRIITRYFGIDTFVYNAMMESNSLRYRFNHEDGINTIRRKLIEYFLEANEHTIATVLNQQ